MYPSSNTTTATNKTENITSTNDTSNSSVIIIPEKMSILKSTNNYNNLPNSESEGSASTDKIES